MGPTGCPPGSRAKQPSGNGPGRPWAVPAPTTPATPPHKSTVVANPTASLFTVRPSR